MPGIIVQTMAFGGFVTALGLAEDLKKGLIDRFRSLPMARSAVLAGRTLADVATNIISLVVMLVVGVLAGFSFDSSVPEILARRGPAAALRLRVLLGVRVPRAQRLVGGVGPGARLHRRLPAHLRLVGLRARGLDARVGSRRSPRSNPITTVVDAIRALWIGAPANNDVYMAVIWSLGPDRGVRLPVGAPLPAGRHGARQPMLSARSASATRFPPRSPPRTPSRRRGSPSRSTPTPSAVPTSTLTRARAPRSSRRRA